MGRGAKRVRTDMEGTASPAPETPACGGAALAAPELASGVERRALRASGRARCRYPGENVAVLEVETFPLLGRLVAARFLEWVQDNPGGVVSLPTGRTPEHFIRWVKRFLAGWDEPEAREELAALGVDAARGRPDMRSLHFVQIDEFYPMDPAQANSFHAYVSEHYIRGFGLDPAKAVLIDAWRLGCPAGETAGALFDGGVDLSLRCRAARTDREAAQQRAIAAADDFCTAYEDRVAALGGIGFFLGGIGPDGHVAFNCRGADLHCTTRLAPTNYETQAAAAGDLGGIETARKSLVITIGMRTITANPDAVAIVFAAGDAKAAVVADTVQGARSNLRPGSALAALPNARFVVTRSAASRLHARVLEDFSRAAASLGPCDEAAHRAVVDVALRAGKRLDEIGVEDLAADPFGAAMLAGRGGAGAGASFAAALAGAARDALVAKIERGLAPRAGATFFHTAPHHDDIMLGYLAKVGHEAAQAGSSHTFAYMTSGFNAVTNGHAASALRGAAAWLDGSPAARAAARAGAFEPPPGAPEEYDRDVDILLDGHAARDAGAGRVGLHRRVLRVVASVFGGGGDRREWASPDWLASSARSAAAYYEGQHPGQKDEPRYQTLKGMLREFEADLLWGFHGFSASKAVRHLRLGFYKGDLFTEEPEVRRDVAPVLELLEAAPPDVVTVALDPEGSGPDTHYKVLQAVAAAVRGYARRADGPGPGSGRPRREVRVWGYRNVWYRFHATEATLMFPTSPSEQAALCDCFDTCFLSQREASFPAPEYDGQFSHLSQKVQAEQYQTLVTLLGRNYFREHPDPRMRAARGCIFIAEMGLQDFARRVRELSDVTE